MAAIFEFKMVVFVTIFVFISGHDAHVSSEKDDSPEIGISRRDKQEWQYEGIPIEFPRRSGDADTTDFTVTSPSIQTTSVSTTLNLSNRRIYNSDGIATIEEFPFMAALLVNNQLWCGGAILSENRVLTAAHCLQLPFETRFFREYIQMLTVRVGSNNATSGGEVLRVNKINFHPKYKPETLEYNFALLELHRNISLGYKDSKVKQIKFAYDRIIPFNSKVLFLGWGSVMARGGSGGKVLLQKLKLPIYDWELCQEIYGKELVTRNNFCAGRRHVAKNICNHDGGGPAIMYGFLVGILAFSSKVCDSVDQPAVFSTVGVVALWLEQHGIIGVS